MKLQKGRSMIEMLAVLAIIGVLSIGGIALYRRAVNNHHANTILDDVNRFAFAIIEKGNYPLDDVIPKGDFKESGIYTLEGYQDAEANQFSITVADVPKGVCEPLLDKATTQYKVRVNPNANEKGKLYDTLNKDLCTNDTNIMVFYFGDTADLCNVPNEHTTVGTQTPCTINADCCGGEFCWYSNDSDWTAAGVGECRLVSYYRPETTTMSDGNTWTRGSRTNMCWWSAQNWCLAQGLKPATRADIGCYKQKETGPFKAYDCNSSVLTAMQEKWGEYDLHWLEDYGNSRLSYHVRISDGEISINNHTACYSRKALCH